MYGFDNSSPLDNNFGSIPNQPVMDSNTGDSGFDWSASPFQAQGTPPPLAPTTVGNPNPAPVATATPEASTASAATTPSSTAGSSSWDWKKFIDDIVNGATGGKGLGSSLGTMAPFLADYALAQKQADRAQSTNQKTIQPLYDEATKYLDAASKELALYESGTITPAQQIMLDQNAATHKAEIASFYRSHGIQDSSMMMTQTQNVDNSTIIMKQGFVDDSLKKALALEEHGIVPLMTAVQDKLISDTELSKTMMELMGNLASAWAYQTAQSGGGGGDGGGGGSAAAGGGIGSAFGKIIDKGKDWLGNLIGQGAGPTAAEIAANIAPVAGPDMAGLYGIGSGIANSALGGGGAAAATGGAGLAEAGMADTAAYAPSIIEATSPATIGGLGTAASLATGVGIIAGAYLLATGLTGRQKPNTERLMNFDQSHPPWSPSRPAGANWGHREELQAAQKYPEQYADPRWAQYEPQYFDLVNGRSVVNTGRSKPLEWPTGNQRGQRAATQVK